MRGRRLEGQDFELNLASIIDCFTVLIAFMLASASFVSIGILDAGVAAASATQTGGAPPSLQLTIALKSDHTAELQVTGKIKRMQSIPALGNEWDYATLSKQLGQLKAQVPDLQAVTLVADNTLPYREVIKSMELIRKTIPVVLLGGF